MPNAVFQYTYAIQSVDEESIQLKLRLYAAQYQVSRLQRANLELRQQAGYWKSCFQRTKKENEELKEKIKELEAENRKLNDRVFGRKSEKSSSRNRSDDLGDEPDDKQTQDSKPAKRNRGQQRGKSGPKRRDYSHLPKREDPPVELPEDQRQCPKCGKPLSKMSSTEDSEQIEVEFYVYRRVIHRCRYHRNCECPDEPITMTAPTPPKLIPKGLYGISLWRELLLNKFHLQYPIERQLEDWRLHDLDLSPGTVAGGMKCFPPLFKPLYKAFCDRNVGSYYKQADETRWRVFQDCEGKTGHLWWLWVYLGEDTVVYRLDPSRSHDVPENYYPSDVMGVLLVDRYAAYKAMAQVKLGLLKLAFCWSHTRRDFVDLGKGFPELKEWALSWLTRIRDLYRLNRQRLKHERDSAEYRQADSLLRQEVQAMRAEAELQLQDTHLRTPCRKVLVSLIEHWEGLTRFVDDPRIPMDNNGSERALRRPAVGRKNYYGSGSLWSGDLAAMLFTIFATLLLWGINARRWLQWYLESCASSGGEAPKDIKPFLPWNLSQERLLELQRIDGEELSFEAQASPEAQEAPDTS